MKNSLWFGIALGTLFPLLAYFLSAYTDLSTVLFPNKALIPYAVAAAINLILVRFFYKKDTPHERIAKGIVLITFLAMLVFLYFHKLRV